MLSHWKRDVPSATKAEVEAHFEKVMLCDENAYIRPLRLKELPEDAVIGVRYYGAFDSDGELRGCSSKRTLLAQMAESEGFAVRSLH